MLSASKTFVVGASSFLLTGDSGLFLDKLVNYEMIKTASQLPLPHLPHLFCVRISVVLICMGFSDHVSDL